MPYEGDSARAEDSWEGGGALSKELNELRASIAARACRYVELCARTNFSFLSGATPPEYMVFRAAELGYDAIGITDRDGLYGIVRACEEAVKHGIRVIAGCELTLERAGIEGLPEIPGKPNTITVLVENHDGYTNLCRILSESHRRHPKNIPLKRKEELEEEDLPKNTWAGIPLSYINEHSAGLWALVDAAILEEPAGREAIKAFGNRLSIAVHLHKDGEDRARVSRAETVARTFGLPICATNRVLYARPQDKPLLDVLYCIREGKTLEEGGRELRPNVEAHLKSEEEMTKLFSLHPEWMARARFIADRCRFSIKELKYNFPYEISDLVHRDFRRPDGTLGENADQALRRLTYDGAHATWGDAIPEKVETQIEKELALIQHLNVAPYFLSVRAIVDMARRRDILCQGRGSAANSAVCFCLGITAVDPSRSNLLFERFLSAERREPPDIDVDFEHERREEVIQEIYSTYGRDRAAMVCEVVSYRSKSALREVGKVFGFSLEQVDRLSGVVSWWDGMSAVSESRLKAIGFSADDPRVRQTLVMARALQGFPRHLSIHVGGFVLSATPLHEVAPIEPATMDDRTIIPWDKDDIDTLGFFKIDVLGLGMLTAIRKCLDLVRGVADETPHYAAKPLLTKSAIERLARIPPEDPKVFDALCNADTVGVFQIESRAQMAMLPRLRPRCFYDLVIEVAIVRPGPIQGGMVHPFLRRRTGEEPAVPPHPILQPILDRTLGVPLFQEQVMQIAIVGAGYSGGEADRLRRDMAAWRKTGSLERHRDRLMAGFRERGIPEEFGERLYQQIHGFAEYGFPECIVGETLIVDAETGRRVPIADIVSGRVPVRETIACDPQKRLRRRRILATRNSGVREVFRVRTALGREFVATASHPFLTKEGWLPLGSLHVRDRVAAARALPVLGHRRLADDEEAAPDSGLRAAAGSTQSQAPIADSVFELVPVDIERSLSRMCGERNALDAGTLERAHQIQHLLLRLGITARVHGTIVHKLANAPHGVGDICWDEIVAIEPMGMRETFDLTIEEDHNFLANDFIVHNSHSSSFALLVYASSWLKLYYPAEFAAALINSQPMGFYSPSTILQDAQRHGVQLLEIDVNESTWDCQCVREKRGDVTPATQIRLGLRLISGLGADAGKRIEENRPYSSPDEVIARARLDKKEAMALAESGALDRLTGSRRAAIWDVVSPRPELMFAATTPTTKAPRLQPMSRAEQLVLDYERTGVSVADHPMKLLRATLPKRFKTSQDVLSLKPNTRVTVAGLVTCRQRPGTASGVVFVTLEDEHGFLNLVLWARVFEKYRHVATTSKMLIVHGKIERSDDPKGLRPPNPEVPQSVVYVIAERLEPFDRAIPRLASMSRDFH
jgi:error-prone DNA polymerase